MKFLTRAEKIDEERDAEVGAGAKEGQMLRQLMGCFQKVVPFVFVKNRGLLRIDCRSRGSCDVSVCVVCVCVCVCWTRGLWRMVQHLIHRFATASSSSGNIHYQVEPQGTGWRKQTWIEGGKRNTITQTWNKVRENKAEKVEGKKNGWKKNRNGGRRRSKRTAREMERENGSPLSSLDSFHVCNSSSPQRESKMKWIAGSRSVFVCGLRKGACLYVCVCVRINLYVLKLHLLNLCRLVLAGGSVLVEDVTHLSGFFSLFYAFLPFFLNHKSIS